MSSDERRTAAFLEERVRLLEAENEILNERSEDILLLGLVAESTSSLRDADAIIETTLEQISVLFEFSYCAFGCIDEQKVVLRHEFVPYLDCIDGSSLSLSPAALRELDHGALIASGPEAVARGIDLKTPGINSSQVIIIPGPVNSDDRSVFLFARDELKAEFRPRMLIILQQVVSLAIARIDNIHLLDELRHLNAGLEARVDERTVELHQAAIALEKEIAERRRAEEIVAGERHRLRAVVENLPEGVIVLDGEDRVLLTNPAATLAEPLTGVFRTGDTLRCIGDRPLADFESSASEPRWQEVSSGHDDDLVYEIALRRLDGDLLGSVIVLRDITDQRTVAKKLLRQERIAAMGHLAAGIAHDFNNLIQAVSIIAEGMLLDDSRDPEARKSKTREILALGERAAALIRQILDYSRQTVSQPQLVDLRSFLTETLAMLNRLIPETIGLEFDSEPGDHTIRIDPVQLQQVLTNLTLNSSQAMPEGGEIRVRLWNTKPNPRVDQDPAPGFSGENWVCISVTDTGCGIQPDARPHIFEPFFTTKERSHGTGLGLAQSYGIVKQHRGQISFESEIDRGTTFTLFFPRESEKAEALDSIGEQPAPARGHQQTVMVVEDDPTVRELTGELIETLGYRPICANDGLDALKLLDMTDREVHLVLCDVAMPGMGGVELTIELGRRESTIPVVLMSGYALGPMGAGFSNKNLVAWLQKPFSVRDLASTLAKALSRKQKT